MARSLPARLSLRYLREEAKDLLKAKRSGDASCCPTLRKLRRFARSSDPDILAADIRLQEVQFALALDYGFADWGHLCRGVALSNHVAERLAYWDRFGPAEGFEESDHGKMQALLADPDWLALAAMERRIGPLTEACRTIRRQIANMERCHGAFLGNVHAVLDMIATMMPGRVLDCGTPGDRQRADAEGYARALEAWLGEDAPVRTPYFRDVRRRIGKTCDRKVGLARHLAARLRNGRYQIPGVEGFDSVEAHIQHLELCIFNFAENVQHVLDEIGRGQPLFAWKHPGGLSHCGACPDRAAELRPLLEDVCAWVSGAAAVPGDWSGRLGKRTDEKRWLAACLCKHITAMHEATCSGEPLPKPTMEKSGR